MKALFYYVASTLIISTIVFIMVSPFVIMLIALYLVRN